MENSDSRDSFGTSSWDDAYRNQAAIQAHTGMDLRHVLSDEGCAAVSDQPGHAAMSTNAVGVLAS
jgi:hypothetical protein